MGNPGRGGAVSAKQGVGQFFEKVYNDKGLQGALNAALCKVAPEAVVEIAKSKGYQFSKEELESATGSKGELHRPGPGERGWRSH